MRKDIPEPMPSTTRRQFLKTLGTGAAMMTLPACASRSRLVRSSPSASRPNILLIMADDMGFSDLGCYGGDARTPHLDRLAGGGLRFSQFYNAARCCPSRASLLTGLYPHEAGMGAMVNGAGDTNPPGPYEGYLNHNCVTVAEVLRGAGYTTLMSGKWHVGESRPNWPVDRGFDRYYGLISGAANYFDIRKGKSPRTVRRFALDGQEITPPNHDWYMTDAISDHAVRQLQENAAGHRPFFQYVAYTAPHYPLMARPEDIARYRGRFMDGWDAMRERRYARLRAMGIIDPSCRLTPRDPVVRPWAELNENEKDEQDLRMAIYCAQIDCMDRGIGRILATLGQLGQTDNTLVLFLSDNGGNAEGGVAGIDYRHNGVPPGGVDSYMSYGQSWANASNTPFRLYKRWVHEGGISTPLIAHWPGRIAARGAITHQVGHLVDFMATCCDVAGTRYPNEFAGNPIKPLRGTSLVPILEGGTRRPPDALYWEHFSNRAVRAGRWKAVTNDDGGWELYDMKADRSEMNNLAAQMPEKRNELVARYEVWAREVGVNSNLKMGHDGEMPDVGIRKSEG